MSAWQTTCTGCGLSVHDLPLEELGADEDMALAAFFQHADDGHLYCNGCVDSGQGVFL